MPLCSWWGRRATREQEEWVARGSPVNFDLIFVANKSETNSRHTITQVASVAVS